MSRPGGEPGIFLVFVYFLSKAVPERTWQLSPHDVLLVLQFKHAPKYKALSYLQVHFQALKIKLWDSNPYSSDSLAGPNTRICLNKGTQNNILIESF